jgi:hypothetical protein
MGIQMGRGQSFAIEDEELQLEEYEGSGLEWQLREQFGNFGSFGSPLPAD